MFSVFVRPSAVFTRSVSPSTSIHTTDACGAAVGHRRREAREVRAPAASPGRRRSAWFPFLRADSIFGRQRYEPRSMVTSRPRPPTRRHAHARPGARMSAGSNDARSRRCTSRAATGESPSPPGPRTAGAMPPADATSARTRASSSPVARGDPCDADPGERREPARLPRARRAAAKATTAASTIVPSPGQVHQGSRGNETARRPPWWRCRRARRPTAASSLDLVGPALEPHLDAVGRRRRRRRRRGTSAAIAVASATTSPGAADADRPLGERPHLERDLGDHAEGAERTGHRAGAGRSRSRSSPCGRRS